MTAFDHTRALEFSSPDEIRVQQEALLQDHLRYLAASSPYYRSLFREQRIAITGATLASLSSLPFTDKTLLSSRNSEFFAAPLSQVVDIVLTSGTTGAPTTIHYTEKDLCRLSYNEQLSFAGCGMTSEDTVLLTCTLDRCFIAGLAYFNGVRSIGAAAIRNGLSSVESHLELIQRLKPTVIVGVPTFLLKLGKHLLSRDLKPESTGVQKLICIGEPVRDRQLAFLKIGADLENIWGAKIYSTYASTETITSFCECTAQQGGHLHPDLAIVEIVDDRGAVVPPGETGEVVVTPLAMEGTPLLRFKTGDVGFLIDGPCSCGRNSVRLGPILGRKAQMLKLRGTTLYPNAIFAALDTIADIVDYYLIASSDYDLSDTVKVCVSLKNGSTLAAAISDRLQSLLRVRPEVVIDTEDAVRQQVYAGGSRKPIRFIDKRKSL